MKKWFKSLMELVADIKAFLTVRREQKKMYGGIIEDLEVINTLSNALNEQISTFSKKWLLFSEGTDINPSQELISVYKKHVAQSQAIYQKTRKDVLNKLLAEKNKQLLSEDVVEPIKVNRNSGITDEDLWHSFVELVMLKGRVVGRIVAACSWEIRENSFVLKISQKNSFFVGIILKHRETLQSCCRTIFGENVALEIEEEVV